MINLIAEAQTKLNVTNLKITDSETEQCYPYDHQIHYDFEATQNNKQVFGWITLSTNEDFNITTHFSLQD